MVFYLLIKLLIYRLDTNYGIRYYNDNEFENERSLKDNFQSFENAYTNSFELPNNLRTQRQIETLDLHTKGPSVKIDSLYYKDPKVKGPQVVIDHINDSVVPSDSEAIKTSPIENSPKVLKDTDTNDENLNTMRPIHDSQNENRPKFTIQNLVFSFIAYFCVWSVVAYIVLTKFPKLSPLDENYNKRHSNKFIEENDIKIQKEKLKQASFPSVISSFISQHKRLNEEDYNTIDESMFSADASYQINNIILVFKTGFPLFESSFLFFISSKNLK